jgi:hypothetical protein
MVSRARLTGTSTFSLGRPLASVADHRRIHEVRGARCPVTPVRAPPAAVATATETADRAPPRLLLALCCAARERQRHAWHVAGHAWRRLCEK